MKKLAAQYASSILSVVAVAFVTVASGWLIHNPKVPKELLK